MGATKMNRMFQACSTRTARIRGSSHCAFRIVLLLLLIHWNDAFLVQSPSRCFALRAVASDLFDDGLTKEQVNALTIPQLKQQLRLRGLKVSGKKQELRDRILHHDTSVGEASQTSKNVDADVVSDVPKGSSGPKPSEHEPIDVTAYLDEEDLGKTVKSSIPINNPPKEPDINPSSVNPEVWGQEARIVSDFDGNSPVLDAMSRTIIEYTGSNQTMIQAYVVASRDAMKPFLAGGKNRTGDPEQRLREIQMEREKASRRPIKFEDELGLDEGDEDGKYKDILHRDFSDWGKFTVTGAQISSEEVGGVLLLSDVYGAYTEDTKALAEKIAFESQPVVVMVPDVFREKAWKEDPTTPGFNEEGKDYEQWRSQHPDLRVSVDIRASAAVLRDQYGVTSITVWGTCFGGGRALEIASGYLPNDNVHDVDGNIGPMPVDPDVVIAWYPTRYDAKALYGSKRRTEVTEIGEEPRQMAVMGVFAGKDELSGATHDDAVTLKSLLKGDDRVKDFMVKVFPDQDHGFAHLGLGQPPQDDSEFDRFVDEEFGGSGRVSLTDADAEVACLLSTAFMETYSRAFLPTTGVAIKEDDNAKTWSKELNMQDYANSARDVRQEIEESLANYKDEPLGGIRIDPTKEDDRDKLAELLRKMEPENVPPEFKINDDDELEDIYAKLIGHDENFQLF